VARSLGAEFVVDYSGDAWAKGVAAAAGNGGVQVVFDGVGGSIGREAFELLAPGGRLCAFGIASGSFAAISEEELAERHVTRLRGAVADPAEMAALSARSLARRGRRVAPGDRTGGTARRGGRSSSCNRGSRDAWEDAARDRATVAARAGMTSKDDCGHRRDRETPPATLNQPRQAGGALT
jgi:Zinc-binding dehydrogenase